MSSRNAQLSSTVSRTRSDTSWPGPQRFESTLTSNLLSPLSLAPLPAISTPIISMPLTSPTTSFLPDLAHERATSPLFSASAFAFRSFTPLTCIPSAFAPLGNKCQHACMIHDPCLDCVLPLNTCELMVHGAFPQTPNRRGCPPGLKHQEGLVFPSLTRDKG